MIRYSVHSDSDPALFVNDLQDANKKIIICSIFFFLLLLILLKVHLHHSSKIKSHKEVAKQ